MKLSYPIFNKDISKKVLQVDERKANKQPQQVSGKKTKQYKTASGKVTVVRI